MKLLLLLVLTAAVALGQYYPPGGGTGGTTVNVNGASVTTPNFNATTPAAGSGYQNVAFQVSGSSVSGRLPLPFGTCSGTISYSNSIFLAAATRATLAVCSLPARAVILHSIIYSTAQWAGTSVTSVKPSLGRSSIANENDQDYIPQPTWDLTAIPTALTIAEGSTSMDMSAHSAYVVFTANTNFGTGAATVLTGGSIDYAIYYVTF